MATQYMAVPEKIELTGNSGPTNYHLPNYTHGGDHPYKSMKIPDTITLDTNGPVHRPVRGEGERGVGGERDDDSRYGERKIEETHPMAREEIPQEKIIPNMSSSGLESHPRSSHDIENRVRTLESKMQTLTEAFLNQRRNGPSPSKGNGFWYVMTFAGWMMVPLIVAFMYQYKKN